MFDKLNYYAIIIMVFPSIRHHLFTKFNSKLPKMFNTKKTRIKIIEIITKLDMNKKMGQLAGVADKKIASVATRCELVGDWVRLSRRRSPTGTSAVWPAGQGITI